MTLQIRPLGRAMGAEVTGVDLGGPLAPEVRDQLYQAFLDHLLLCFRDQTLDHDGFLRAARHFGDPKVQLLEGYRVDGYPEIGVVSSDDLDRAGDGKRIVRGTMFHTDESFLAVPPKATILYAVDVPKEGGDTRFINLYAAYDTLPEAVRTRIDGLRAVHNYAKRRPGRKVPKLGAAEKVQTPPVEHPIARSHDETRRKALYVHETMTDYVAGLPHDDSEALLQCLYRHSTGTEDFQYRHQWRQGDFVMWDDRCTLHAATADYAETERRLLYRTLLAGVPSA